MSKRAVVGASPGAARGSDLGSGLAFGAVGVGVHPEGPGDALAGGPDPGRRHRTCRRSRHCRCRCRRHRPLPRSQSATTRTAPSMYSRWRTKRYQPLGSGIAACSSCTTRPPSGRWRYETPNGPDSRTSAPGPTTAWACPVTSLSGSTTRTPVPPAPGFLFDPPAGPPRKPTRQTGSPISLVGMPQSHVSLIENRKRRVTSADVVTRIAEGLQVPDELRGLPERRKSVSASWGPDPELSDRITHVHRTGHIDVRSAERNGQAGCTGSAQFGQSFCWARPHTRHVTGQPPSAPSRRAWWS